MHIIDQIYDLSKVHPDTHSIKQRIPQSYGISDCSDGVQSLQSFHEKDSVFFLSHTKLLNSPLSRTKDDFENCTKW